MESFPAPQEEERDDSPLNEALAGLITVQGLLDLGIPEADLIDEFEKHSKIIHDKMAGHTIYAIGPMVIPELDSLGHVVGLAHAEGSIEGMFDDTYCANLQTEGSDESRLVVGISLESGSKFFKSIVEKSDIGYRSFFPAESSTFTICEDDKQALPEEGDEIAQEIDICLLNKPVDLASLADYISAKFKSTKSDLEREYYINYINKLADFTTITTISEQVDILSSGLSRQHVNRSSEAILTHGEFCGFTIKSMYESEDTQESASEVGS